MVFIRWLVMAASSNEPGGSEPISSRPGGRFNRSVTAGDRAQSIPRSPTVPNTDAGCSGTKGYSR